jgi:hypothetical protein
MNRQICKTGKAVVKSGAMEPETISNNGASPNSQTSRVKINLNHNETI